MRTKLLTAGGICLIVLAMPFAAAGQSLEGIEARIRAEAHTISPGNPVLLEFLLRNKTDSPIVLSVPGTTVEPVGSVTELPLPHVFSGAGFTGLTIRGDYNHTWTDVYGYHPPPAATEIVLGPHAIVGAVLVASDFYPALRSPGNYRLVWQPYGGLVTSNQLNLKIEPRKRAVILTDAGSMKMDFMYELAPNHVANFIELAKSGFYSQLTFHRIEPGYFMQGGCPNGDGTGIRLDGKKLEAEFSDYPVVQGTVCMARLESDPDSASCQFLIANTRMPEWDGKYTVFGQLVDDDSYETLEKLMRTEVNRETGRPERAVIMRSVRIEDAPREQATPSIPETARGRIPVLQTRE